MNWEHVMLSAVVGAVLYTLISVIRKKGWIGKKTSIVAIIVALIIWNYIDTNFLIPKNGNHSGFVEAKKIDEMLATVPSIALFKELEPELWQSIFNQLAQMHKEKKTEQQMIDVIQPQILKIQMKSLQNAPDTNVVDYMKINLEQVAIIQKSSNENCFKFIFPHINGGINGVNFIPKNIIQKRLDANESIMKIAYGENKHIVTEQERELAINDGRAVLNKLEQIYHDDVYIMMDPINGVGKEKIACDINQDFWKLVIELPEKNAAGVIRLAMSYEM